MKNDLVLLNDVWEMVQKADALMFVLIGRFVNLDEEEIISMIYSNKISYASWYDGKHRRIRVTINE